MEIVGLVLFLSVLAYTAIVIAEEKRAYRENIRPYQIGGFCFPTPPWWKNISQGREKTLFTASDWRGIFQLLPPNKKTLQKSLAQRIECQEIVFDADTALYHPPLIKQSVQISRMEGIATEKEEKRIYFDAFLMECLNTGQRLYGESKSPILSGPLEGPWFEECLNNCYAVHPVEKREKKNNESF